MKKILGIFGLLVAVFVVAWIAEPNFASSYNLQNIIRWTALFGIISIGVAFVIITGGIDLSIGSVIGLVASLLAFTLNVHHWNPAVALVAMLVLSALIGLAHGLLITKVKLQPFVVTLCGLLIYRGIARWVTDNQSMGFPGQDRLDYISSAGPLVGLHPSVEKSAGMQVVEDNAFTLGRMSFSKTSSPAARISST